MTDDGRMVKAWQEHPALVAVHDACEASKTADQELARAVSAARAAGYSWENVAAALGMARQSAWERFRHLDP